jgi:polysaccharide chain length determinant protein (PEP-CTERM system associated)
MSEFEADAPAGFQLEDALEILERWKWWIAAGALVGAMLGVGLCFVLPPKYESITVILVEPQKVPEEFVRSAVTQEVGYQVNSLRQRVTGYTNLNKLIDNLGADRFDPDGESTREDLMNEIRRNLRVKTHQSQHTAPVFEIAYASADPELAAEVAREIAELFISENIIDRTQQAESTSQFLDRELDRIRAEVSEQEKQLGIFRSERMGSLPEQLDANLRSLDRLNFEFANNLEAQASANQRIALLRRQATGTQPGAPGSSAPSNLAEALQDARQRLFEAERIYTDEHPNVQHLKAQIERLENEIAEAPPVDGSETKTVLADPRLLALQREIEAAQYDLTARKRREERIRSEIETLQVKVEETPVREQELRNLTRDYANLSDTYHTLLSKKYEAAISRNLELAQKGQQFKLLRPARVPETPSSPDPRALVPAGIAFGLAVVGLFIAIGEIRYPAFRSVSRLTRMIGLPVFASIPRIDNDAIYEVSPSGDVDPKLVVYTAPSSSPAEQYRGFLPTVIEAENCKVILVTSATRGDGKSLTCMNLAISLATDLNKRILVIDSDMRRPTAHRLVRISRLNGLSNILEGKAELDDCAINSKIPRLAVLPAGPTPRNPLALLTGKRFLELIEYARASYDMVLIDSPPLLPVVDTRILREMADMLVFVVRADATPPQAVVRSLQNLRGAAGVIFNGVSPGSFRRYYYYDAYSRYAYGDDQMEADEESNHV